MSSDCFLVCLRQRRSSTATTVVLKPSLCQILSVHSHLSLAEIRPLGDWQSPAMVVLVGAADTGSQYYYIVLVSYLLTFAGLILWFITAVHSFFVTRLRKSTDARKAKSPM